MDHEGDIVIREMTQEDAKICEEKIHLLGNRMSLYASYQKNRTSHAHFYIVAFYKKQLAGFAMLDWQSTYEDFSEAHIPEIKDLWVFESLRNKGIAYEMMKVLEKEAVKESNLCGVGVGLTESFLPAQRLFEKLGYKPDGRGIYYPESQVILDKQEVDDNQALMMIKQIDD